MLRLWSEAETKVLRDYIDQHRGHTGGLKGAYWETLFHCLEGVRARDAKPLQKIQVNNKIFAFGRRSMATIEIMKHGLDGLDLRRTATIETPRRTSRQSPVIINSDNLEDHSNGALAICNYDASQNIGDDCAERTFETTSHALTAANSEDALTVLGNIPAAAPTYIQVHLKSPTPSSRSYVSSSSSCVSERLSKKRKLEVYKSTREEQSSATVARERPIQGIHSKIAGLDNQKHNDDASPGHFCTKTRKSNSNHRLHHENSPYTDDTEGNSWPQEMFQVWSNHLACQNSTLTIHYEPLEHREVSCRMEEISANIYDATLAMHKLFPFGWDLSKVGPSMNQIATILTGFKVQSDIEDILNVAQSLHPLSNRINLLYALMGTTMHLWIFDKTYFDVPTVCGYDQARMQLEVFIERECPEIWNSYQDLSRRQFLSSYNEERISNEAERLTKAFYAIMLTAGSCDDHRNSTTTTRNQKSVSTDFPPQVQHYKKFKDHMSEAYRLALDLRISLEKCGELTYEFQFPHIRQRFNSTCMEVRKFGEDNRVRTEDQLVAVGLLPSIWSRPIGDNSQNVPSNLVTKAVVLL